MLPHDKVITNIAIINISYCVQRDHLSTDFPSSKENLFSIMKRHSGSQLGGHSHPPGVREHLEMWGQEHFYRHQDKDGDYRHLVLRDQGA